MPIDAAAAELDVSIVIVSFNTREMLHSCLTSVYAHTQALSVEVIVVDNASSDGSVDMLRQQFPQVRVIENPDNRRYAAANNQGLEIARGRYVLYLNSDTALQGNSIKELAEFLDAHSDAGGVGCPLIYSDGSFQESAFRFPSALTLFYQLCCARFYWKTRLAGNYQIPAGSRRPLRVDFVSGACLMAPRELLEQCRGMDTDFYFYGEDLDLCYRIRNSGKTVYYLPESSKIIHHAGGSTPNFFNHDQRRKHLMGWKSRVLFIKKHYPAWRRALALVAVFGALGVNAALYGLAALKRRDVGYMKVNLGVYIEIAGAAWRVMCDGLHE